MNGLTVTVSSVARFAIAAGVPILALWDLVEHHTEIESVR